MTMFSFLVFAAKAGTHLLPPLGHHALDLHQRFVIASAAKQSRAAQTALGCFAALAMTNDSDFLQNGLVGTSRSWVSVFAGTTIVFVDGVN